MVVPETRFSLRLESGERAGEEVAIPAAGLSVGRRPENGLCINESSVSGQHAKLVLEGDVVVLRDLGSTNGTRVGGEKVTEKRLAHGDAILFGGVRVTFQDRAMATGARARPSNEAAVGEAVRTASQERVKRAGRRGFLGIVAVLVLAGAALGAVLVFLGREKSESQGGGIPVVAVDGNLVADPSFEGETSDWESADEAPAAFYRDGSFRRAGTSGLGVELDAGGFARASSPAVPLHARRGYELRAALAADGAAEACVGLELATADGSRAPFVAWSAPVADSGGFEDIALAIASLPGYDRLRVVVEARASGAGSASLDDVVLLEQDAMPPSAASHEGFELYLFGDPPRTAVLARTSEVVLAGLRLREPDTAGAAGLARWAEGTFAAEANEGGMRLFVHDAAPGAVLAFQAGGGALPEGAEATPFIATTGPDGFQAYTTDFEGARATALLLGRGIDLLRLGFPEPVAIDGALTGAGLRVAVHVGGIDAVDLQLSFREERTRAGALADAARGQERSGEVGAALRSWSELLNAYPFEAALVAEAEAARSRLLNEGLQALGALRAEVERARFFGLADLFRRSAASAAELGRRYAGSEVEAEAARLVAEIDAEAAALDEGRSTFERQRLEAVLKIAEAQQWDTLAGRLRDELEGGGPSLTNGSSNGTGAQPAPDAPDETSDAGDG